MTAAKILVIEDDVTFRDVLCANLEDEGYQVIPLETGTNAISTAASLLPDIILVDYRLPGLDGYEICRQLKSFGPTRNIPVIMITGRNSESDIVTALELGAEDFLSKPFSNKILIAKI